jgi:hypothetical protein
MESSSPRFTYTERAVAWDGRSESGTTMAGASPLLLRVRFRPGVELRPELRLGTRRSRRLLRRCCPRRGGTPTRTRIDRCRTRPSRVCPPRGRLLRRWWLSERAGRNGWAYGDGLRDRGGRSGRRLSERGHPVDPGGLRGLRLGRLRSRLRLRLPGRRGQPGRPRLPS